MSQKRPARRLLACAALSAGVLLGSGVASAEAPRPAPARSPFAALLDAALRIASTASATDSPTNHVELQPVRRMGNTKGPGYTDCSVRTQVARARPVQARTPARAPK